MESAKIGNVFIFDEELDSVPLQTVGAPPKTGDNCAVVEIMSQGYYKYIIYKMFYNTKEGGSRRPLGEFVSTLLANPRPFYNRRLGQFTLTEATTVSLARRMEELRQTLFITVTEEKDVDLILL